MRVLLDTCIIIDALQSRKPFKDSAEQIFLCTAKEKFKGFLTAKSITDIYYLTRRLTHDDKKTRKIISDLFVLFSPLDTFGIDCQKAIFSDMADYEDAVMAETALRTKMDCIVTRNTKDYTNCPVPVYQPGEFLSFVVSNENE